jgi:hypothetical protein
MQIPNKWLVFCLSSWIAIASYPQAAQSNEENSPFKPMEWLVGEWRGYGEFSDRTTYIHKSFSYRIRGRFLVEKTFDMFPPSEPSTEFEIHQDFVVYYNDGGRLKAKGFYVESFVSNADVTIKDTQTDLIVIEASRIENGPEGMRTRYTIRKGKDEDHFTATFEIALPERDFVMIETLKMERWD